MKNVLFATLAGFMAGCSNPISPTVDTSKERFPGELQSVVNFLREDSWRHPLLGGMSLAEYVEKHVAQAVYDPAVAKAGFGAYVLPGDPVLRWSPQHNIANTGMEGIAGSLLHEARHFDGFPTHECGHRDCSMAEGGAYAVQILYLEHRGLMDVAAGLRRDAIGRW